MADCTENGVIQLDFIGGNFEVGEKKNEETIIRLCDSGALPFSCSFWFPFSPLPLPSPFTYSPSFIMFATRQWLSSSFENACPIQVPGLQDVHLGSSPFKSVKGGYGVAYRIGEEHFLITVNAFKDRERADPHRHFASSLEKSLVTLGELLPFVPKPQK